jgi:general secretion pathway protein G
MFYRDKIRMAENEISALKLIRERQADRRGFTLIEILFAISIVCILVVISFSTFTNFKDSARVARAAAEIREIEKVITGYALEKGSYPAALTDLTDTPKIDPWGRPYVYKTYVKTEMRNLGAIELNSDFDLYSIGKDGLTNQSVGILDTVSYDDVIRASEGSFVGSVKQFLY